MPRPFGVRALNRPQADMNLQNITVALSIAMTLTLLGCTGGSAETTSAAVQASGEATEADSRAPDLDTVAERSTEYWKSIVAADWIQAYDFTDPATREIVGLGQFLQQKEHHEYRNPSQPKLIGSEGDLAYLELAVLWEPHHPILSTVRDKPADMTQELHMVETWRWVDGDWFFVGNDRQEDFHAEHPGLRAKDADSGK